MSESTWFVIAIVIYLLVMVGIGWWGYKQTSDHEDFTVGGRGLPPFVAALSAGAADMSGWLLMGLPGALYVSGFSQLWMVIGLLAGAFCNWLFVAPKLRAYSEISGNSITIPSFFESRTRDRFHVNRIVAASIIIFFFVFYVSSGMVSSGRYWEATFNGNYLTGVLIVAAVTIFYTFVGGFLAVSYTDAVQGMIMFFALLIVPVMAIFTLDHPGDIFTYATSHAYGPWPQGNSNYYNLFFGVSAVAIISNLAWGLGYFGQPHVLVRFLALRTPQEAKSGRRWAVSWMTLSMIGAVFVAMIGTVFFAQKPQYHVTDQQHYETVFLDMARILFHPLIAGLILTAVLAAIMSTMSSQLLVISSSLVEDIYRAFKKERPSDAKLMWLSRGCVIVVALIALAMSIHPSDSILGLVAFAWAGFGAAFGPVVLASLYWKRLTSQGALAGMIVGAVVTVFWGANKFFDLYELVPGAIAATIALVVVSLMTKVPAEVATEFDEASELSELAAKNEDVDFATEAAKIRDEA